jgi:hypothetical protein
MKGELNLTIPMIYLKVRIRGMIMGGERVNK